VSTKPSSRRKAWDNFKAFYFRQFISLIWMLVAVGIGLTLRENILWLKTNVDYPLMALLSGIIGIMIPNFVHFGSAGKVLTKSENPRINLLVGVTVTLLVLLFANALLNQFL
jgi:hypothetical protein